MGYNRGMKLSFEVWGRVRRPRARVFRAVQDPRELSAYFTTGGAKGRLVSGATVTWDFADFPGAFPVQVKKAVKGRSLLLSWGSATGGRNDVLFTFKSVGPRSTEVRVREAGWPDTPKGRKAAFGNCMGWSQMLAALKAWCEHGLNLREGFYR
jgi:uncharacterized protein YndB with AHSA1/START domain